MSQAVALPYAKAAFEYAEKHQKLEMWSQALEALAKIFVDKKVCELLKNPALDHDAIGEAICEEVFRLFGDGGLKNLIRLLASNQRLLLIPEIYQKFEEYRIAYEKVVPVQIISSDIILPSQQEKLMTALRIRLQRKVEPEFIQDPNIIAGVVIRIGDKIIDGSISNTLSRMLKDLVQA